MKPRERMLTTLDHREFQRAQVDLASIKSLFQCAVTLKVGGGNYDTYTF
jgi:hypothetical protein